MLKMIAALTIFIVLGVGLSQVFGEEYIKVMNHIGIKELVRSEWLFKGNIHKDA